jgi:hypothetical protein
LVRAFAIWLLIIFVESLHGTVRQLFLAPLVGDLPARRISFFSGMLLIFTITYLFINWIGTKSTKRLLSIGLLWMFLTAFFEFGLGIFIFGYTQERMLEDYDLSRGGLMAIGLIFMLFAPFLAARICSSKR